MVYPTGPRTQARVSRDTWSTPRGLGYSPQLPRRAGPLRGPSGTGSSHPGCLLETAVPTNRARVTQENWSTTGPRTLTGVTWDSWSTPWALKPGPESLRTACRHRMLSDPGTSCPVVLDESACLELQCESPGTASRPRRISEPSASGPGLLVEPAGVELWPESPRTAGRPHGPLDTSQSPPGLLVNPGGHQTQAQVALECCSTLWALGHSPELPRKAGRHHGPLGMGPSRRGMLVHPTGYRT